MNNVFKKKHSCLLILWVSKDNTITNTEQLEGRPMCSDGKLNDCAHFVIIR